MEYRTGGGGAFDLSRKESRRIVCPRDSYRDSGAILPGRDSNHRGIAQIVHNPGNALFSVNNTS